MNTYEVTLGLRGTVTVQVTAMNKEEAAEEAWESWTPSDLDVEDFDVDREEVVCIGRPEHVSELGDTDEEQLIKEIASTTARQFRILAASGVKRTLYAVPEIVEDFETLNSLVAGELRGVAHFKHERTHTYLEAVSQ